MHSITINFSLPMSGYARRQEWTSESAWITSQVSNYNGRNMWLLPIDSLKINTILFAMQH